MGQKISELQEMTEIQNEDLVVVVDINDEGDATKKATYENLKKSMIVDNLITIDTDKALSANQGKILNDKISSLVVDNLESTDTTKALSANQGYILNQAVTPEDFIDKVVFTEEANTSVCIFKKIGKMIVVNYMGASVAHAKSAVLCTLPEGYRPKVRFWVPFIKNDFAYGTLFVGTDGIISINTISNTTEKGRIYSQIVFFVE